MVPTPHDSPPAYQPHAVSNTGFKSLRKELKSLHQRQERITQHRVWLEGRHCIESALEAGWHVETLLSRADESPSVVHDVNTLFDLATRLGYDTEALANSWLSCPAEALVSVCDAKSCPTLAAVVVPPVATRTHEGLTRHGHGNPFITPTSDDILACYSAANPKKDEDEDEEAQTPAKQAPSTPDPSPKKLMLGLWGIQDPGNLGTLLRSAVAFGVTGVVLMGEGCVDPWGPKALRAAAGMTFKIPVYEGGELVSAPEALLMCIGTQAELVGTCSTQDTTPYRTPKQSCYVFPWQANHHFLLLGCEGTGIPKNLDQHLEHWVTIPTSTKAESLNVAMAGSILLSASYQATIPL